MPIQSSNHTGNSPKVSIIMNCLNCEKYLHEAIDSVYSQTYKDWEIIFWDNNSTDKSAEIAKGYDEKLRYFKGNETVPLGKARNLAIKQAKGEYIAFLDCDDSWLPLKLEKQVHLLENRPEIDFVYSNYFRIIKTNNRRILVLKGKQPDGDVFERFIYHFPVLILTVMLRKAALDKRDITFDEKFKVAEDYDIFMRIVYESRVAYMDEILAIYRIHPNMSTIKFPELFPDEITCVIDKFKQMDFLFEKKYSTALNHLYAELGILKARAEMAQGNSQKARVHLCPYKWVGYNFFVLYLTTYFPSRVWYILYDLRNKGYL